MCSGSIDSSSLYHVLIRERSAPQHHSSTLTGAPEGPDQAAFWESLANVLPESKLKLWTALDSALEKYQ